MEMSADRERRPVVTMAALYGASGSVIGPRVAMRLGVPLPDREIPEAVAREAALTDDAVAAIDDRPTGRWNRLVQRLGGAGTRSGDIDRSSDLDLQDRELRSRVEAFLARPV